LHHHVFAATDDRVRGENGHSIVKPQEVRACLVV